MDRNDKIVNFFSRKDDPRFARRRADKPKPYTNIMTFVHGNLKIVGSWKPTGCKIELLKQGEPLETLYWVAMTLQEFQLEFDTLKAILRGG